MKKRILAFLLALTISFSLVACSGDTEETTAPAEGAASTSTETDEVPAEDASGEMQAINVWMHTNNVWVDSHAAIAEAYMAENPGYEVVYSNFPYGDFQSKMQTSLLSDDFADVYEIWGGWATDFVETNTLAAVPENITATFDDYYAPTLGSYMANGNYYGVPVEFNMEYGTMLVNKMLFEESGHEYPTTWDELLSVSEQVSVQNGEIMEMRGYDIVGADSLMNAWTSMILSLGGEYFTEGEGFNFNTPEAAQALKDIMYFIYEGHTNLEGVTGKSAEEFFFIDESYMTIKGSWIIPSSEENYGKVYGTDYDYIPIPAYTDTPVFTAETGWGLVVPEKSENKDAAWKYIEYFTSPEVLISHNIACGQIPPSMSGANDPSFVESVPFMSAVVPILDTGAYIGKFNTQILKDALINLVIELEADPAINIEERLVTFTDAINAELN